MGGDFREAKRHRARRIVSIHAPAWGATSPLAKALGSPSFNPRPRWGRPQTAQSQTRVRFQSTPTHWGRRKMRQITINLPFQSTPPHGGRLFLANTPVLRKRSFNHAPAWGRRDWGFATHRDVSIHAHAGGDWRGSKKGTRKVSIHAPAWGATIGVDLLQAFAVFQSTPPHGGRRVLSRHPGLVIQFQSTPPHGGRPQIQEVADFMSCFNPRPRMGGDFQEWEDLPLRHVSIHAPAWGATGPARPTFHADYVSIHAPAWGATGL